MKMKDPKRRSGSVIRGYASLAILIAALCLCACGEREEFLYGETLKGQEAAGDLQDTEDAVNSSADPHPGEDTGNAAVQKEDPDTGKQVRTADAADKGVIYVQVCGAVQKPGVYEVSPDARVFEAVNLAGGMLPDAAFEAINQAARLSDGELIRIPTQEEWQESGQKELVSANFAGNESSATDGAENGASDGRIDLNTADVSQLMTLPGIGQSKAESIISYRESNGPFQKIEEIKNVSGIKDGLFQKIKDKIRV